MSAAMTVVARVTHVTGLLQCQSDSHQQTQRVAISYTYKAGPAFLIRIRINTLSVSITPYCVFQQYLPYLTVGKYGFCPEIWISQNTY